ncbi:S-layer homology domain-containing protein [Halobacillus dabanensis]|uniref:S-layer homology domain-containing protein n=1 Tax=Halobacillus dabanensis TaxID=240302 RepID=A0A1I3XEW3_HALDA|nr:S-layer homology domain-containing protein [Halobacillus dabanensis]SFK18032.1 S-layer homology domain-containing protein [Halobacillus dabanensis]
MRKIVSFVFAITLVLSFSNYYVSAENFPDLDTTPWAKEEIIFLNEQGIINGLPDGKFGPKVNVTRAQVAVMLVRDLYPNESPRAEPPFNDLSETAYYYDDLVVAYEKGIMQGDGENMRPTDYISRAEVAVMVDRAYEIKRNEEVYGFSDANNISWATESILDLNSLHIINGLPDGTFKPFKNITRAEFAKVLAATIEPSFRKDTTPELLSNSQIAAKVDQLQDKVFHTMYDDLMEHAIYPSDNRDYNRIEGDLNPYITDDFNTVVERAYYNACVECDSLYFAKNFAWDIHTNVLENNQNEIIVETAQLENYAYYGSFEIITLQKEEGNWKLQARDWKRFEARRHLNLTVDQAKQRIIDHTNTTDISYWYSYDRYNEDAEGDYYITKVYVFMDNKSGDEIEVDSSTGGIPI